MAEDMSGEIFSQSILIIEILSGDAKFITAKNGRGTEQ